jgi:hypothetical protein
MASEQVSIVIRAKDAASKVFGSVQKSLHGIRDAAGAVARTLAIVTAAAAGAVVGMAKMAIKGGEIVNVQRAFNRAVGGEGAEALGRLREATSGLINDYDLMVGFNKALTMGAVENAQQFGELAQTALALGRAMGLDANFALEKLNLGLARQSKLLLDDLGITMSVEQANKRYAASINKSATALTDEQKRLAFRTEAMRQARVAVENLGGVQLNAGDKAQQLGVKLQNVVAQLSAMVARSPQVAAFFEMLQTSIERLTPTFEAMVNKFTTWMGKITSFVTTIGDIRGWTNAIERFERAHIDRIKSDVDALDAYIDAQNARIGVLNQRIAELGTTKAGRRTSIYKEMQDEVESLTLALNYANEQKRLLVQGGGAGTPALTSKIPPWYGRPRMAGAGLAAVTGRAGTPLPWVAEARELSTRMRMITYQRNYLARLEDEGRAKDLATQQTEQMAMTVVHAFGAIAQSGGSLASTLIGGVASIAASIGGVTPVGAAAILTGGSILSRSFSSGPTPVEVARYAPLALQQQQDIIQPIHLTNIIKGIGDVEIARTERELLRRSRRDASFRIYPGSLTG